jgi:hypothetical protein
MKVVLGGTATLAQIPNTLKELPDARDCEDTQVEFLEWLAKHALKDFPPNGSLFWDSVVQDAPQRRDAIEERSSGSRPTAKTYSLRPS